MIIGKIISGGQTGVDQGALLAASNRKIVTGGFAAAGFKTEKGPQRKLLQDLGLVDYHLSYKERTRTNVMHSDCTVIISANMSGGTAFTKQYCEHLKKPYQFILAPFSENQYDYYTNLVIGMCLQFRTRPVINFAGNRESKCPGIQDMTIKFVSYFIDQTEWPEGIK